MIEISNLSCGYNEAILSDINLDFATSEVTVILGANGAGKSCLFDTIIGKVRPLSGQIKNLSSDYSNRSNQIAYASQYPIERARLSVKAYLDLIKPLYDQACNYVLEQMNITELLSKELAHLSAGERQRVRLACTILQNSHLYLLDEPTTSLDPRPIDQLCSVIRSSKYKDRGFVIISHDLGFALKVGTYFVGLKHGQIAFKCKKSELVNSSKLDSLFDKKFNWHQTDTQEWFVC